VKLARALALGLVLAPLACGGSTRSGGGQTSPEAVGRAALELREGRDRPPIALVSRSGDPESALTLAVAHDLGSRASVTLARLLRDRLKKSGFSVEMRAHHLGFVLTALASESARAIAFVKAATDAMARPVSARELTRDLVPVPRLTGPSDAAVADCSGELGESAPAKNIDFGTLESHRARIHSAKAAAFGAVGARNVLDAAALALEDGPEWPAVDGPADPWPSSGHTGVELARHGERMLSIAFRIPEAARALAAARTLGEAGTPLALRLASLEPSWEIERVVATARPRGACLRIDVKSDRMEPLRSVDVARTALLVDLEAHRALARVTNDAWFLDEAVLAPSDPRAASAAAAWRALTGRNSGDAERRFVSFVTQPNEVSAISGAELERTMARIDKSWKRPLLEQRSKLETGQGELWALVGSTCGTVAETASDAGAAALIMSSLARRSPEANGVNIEPWVTTDGVGLFAHATRASAQETPDQLARRVGEALGRALVSVKISGTLAAEAREGLLEDLGPGPRPGFVAALGALSGGHPSWLDPRGGVSSLSALETHVLEARRRALLSGPIRLAVLANATASQPTKVAEGLEDWLRPFRVEPTSCPRASVNVPKRGEISVELAEGARPAAYVATPIGSHAGGVSREAEWTAYLMNREGGWLGQTLGPSGSGRAAVLGGKNAAGIVVELQSSDDPAPLVASVRSLFDRLSRGAATQDEAEIARRRFAELGAEAQLDPHFRLVTLFGGSAPRRTDLASLRRFQQGLAADRHVVVYVRAK
jgi:hypothetical protein